MTSAYIPWHPGTLGTPIHIFFDLLTDNTTTYESEGQKAKGRRSDGQMVKVSGESHGKRLPILCQWPEGWDAWDARDKRDSGTQDQKLRRSKSGVTGRNAVAMAVKRGYIWLKGQKLKSNRISGAKNEHVKIGIIYSDVYENIQLATEHN